jgi:hypothetical protein
MDLQTRQAKLAALAPPPVTAGMAMDAANIYFGSGSSLYSYRWASFAMLRQASDDVDFGGYQRR